MENMRISNKILRIWLETLYFIWNEGVRISNATENVNWAILCVYVCVNEVLAVLN